MLNIVQYRLFYFLVSLVIIVGGLIALYLGPGLRWSVEFSSGAAVRSIFVEPEAQADVERVIVSDLGYQEAVVQGIGEREFFIRLPLDGDTTAQQQRVEAALAESVGALEGVNFDIVSPAVARETIRNGAIAVAFAVVGILAYIVWAFRGIRHAFRYGIAAIVALVHDILMAFAIAGIITALFPNLVHIQLSSMFLIGILTLLGFSINDTIVVFDRFRENQLRDRAARDLGTIVNISILETMARSLNTNITALLVLLALLLLGPTSIQDFLFVMIVAVTAGSYSSIFIAAPILVTWETKSLGTLPFLGRRGAPAAPQPAPER
jgi:preprotein translocase subunit SecF